MEAREGRCRKSFKPDTTDTQFLIRELAACIYIYNIYK